MQYIISNYFLSLFSAFLPDRASKRSGRNWYGSLKGRTTQHATREQQPFVASVAVCRATCCFLPLGVAPGLLDLNAVEHNGIELQSHDGNSLFTSSQIVSFSHDFHLEETCVGLYLIICHDKINYNCHINRNVVQHWELPPFLNCDPLTSDVLLALTLL